MVPKWSLVRKHGSEGHDEEWQTRRQILQETYFSTNFAKRQDSLLARRKMNFSGDRASILGLKNVSSVYIVRSPKM